MLVLFIVEVKPEILEGKRNEPINPASLLAAFSNDK